MGEVDHVGGAFGALMGLCRECFTGQAGVGEVLQESGFRHGGPEGDFAIWF